MCRWKTVWLAALPLDWMTLSPSGLTARLTAAASRVVASASCSAVLRSSVQMSGTWMRGTPKRTPDRISDRGFSRSRKNPHAQRFLTRRPVYSNERVTKASTSARERSTVV